MHSGIYFWLEANFPLLCFRSILIFNIRKCFSSSDSCIVHHIKLHNQTSMASQLAWYSQMGVAVGANVVMVCFVGVPVFASGEKKLIGGSPAAKVSITSLPPSLLMEPTDLRISYEPNQPTFVQLLSPPPSPWSTNPEVVAPEFTRGHAPHVMLSRTVFQLVSTKQRESFWS